MSSSTTVKKEINIKGSSAIVTEFFGYSINSILYQRGVYPPEMFIRVNKYGLTLLVSNDKGLSDYIKKILDQVKEWLLSASAQKLVLVINSIETKEVLERWVFNIEAFAPSEAGSSGSGSVVVVEKSEKEINKEIAAIIRQITASVSFLPLLQERCEFDMLVYTSTDAIVSDKWEDSDARLVKKNAMDVKLKSFSTKLHRIEGVVSYQGRDE